MTIHPSRRELVAGGVALAGLGPLAPGCAHLRPALLPQDDPDGEARLAMLEAARGAYRYTWDKPNLRGVAMCDTLPPTERPGPVWLGMVAQVLAEVGGNDAVSRGEPPPSPDALLERLTAAGLDAGAAMFELLGEVIRRPASEGVASSLGDYSAQFGLLPRPAEADLPDDDATFARLRVAGPNPGVLRRVDPHDGLPGDLAITEALARPGLAEGDSLEAALAEGRLFLCAYRELLETRPGSEPLPADVEVKPADRAAWDAAVARREAAYPGTGRAKVHIAPLALFAVPPGGGALRPVAIQLLPEGTDGASWPVLTPADGVAWRRARTMVNSADATVHEAIAHLALTHLVQEAFNLAMHHCLAVTHPLHRLLAPHFEGTFLINSAADAMLVAPGNKVDQLLLPTIGSTIAMGAAALRAYDFNAAMFPVDLERRGLADAALLPEHPFRDDGRLVWDALRGWVKAWVEHTYASDAVVQADGELQAFVRQVGQHRETDGLHVVGGGIRGVGEGGGVRTRAYLTDLVTQIIFNGSAQHAAVNFPQSGPLAWTPRMPMSSFGPLPTPGDPEEAWLAQLPRLDNARAQLSVCWLLGTLHHTRLGHYLPDTFRDRPLRAALSQLQGDLDDAERTIEERNRSRVPYPWLLPSKIPQSTNI